MYTGGLPKCLPDREWEISYSF
uniref:Uncharacterized protein n=1 Tax=Arundo donax TaxID=35708 RepID=A0A0A9FSG0_ARUDO